MGNLLRYPSQVYNNLGLQWFIPYLMAIVLLAIPALALEIAVGNAYRGGCVVAYNNMSSRMKGTGLALNYVGLVVVTYFVPILAWIMVYFRNSFTSPLPWMGKGQEFYMRNAVGAVDPVEQGGWITYPGTSIVGELAGWTAFTWFIVWLCMFQRSRTHRPSCLFHNGSTYHNGDYSHRTLRISRQRRRGHQVILCHLVRRQARRGENLARCCQPGVLLNRCWFRVLHSVRLLQPKVLQCCPRRRHYCHKQLPVRSHRRLRCLRHHRLPPHVA